MVVNDLAITNCYENEREAEIENSSIYSMQSQPNGIEEREKLIHFMISVQTWMKGVKFGSHTVMSHGYAFGRTLVHDWLILILHSWNDPILLFGKSKEWASSDGQGRYEISRAGVVLARRDTVQWQWWLKAQQGSTSWCGSMRPSFSPWSHRRSS